MLTVDDFQLKIEVSRETNPVTFPKSQHTNCTTPLQRAKVETIRYEKFNEEHFDVVRVCSFFYFVWSSMTRSIRFAVIARKW